MKHEEKSALVVMYVLAMFLLELGKINLLHAVGLSR